MNMLNSEMVSMKKKMAANSKTTEQTMNSYTTCIVNSSQKMDAGVLFIGDDSVLIDRNCHNLGMINTIPCM